MTPSGDTKDLTKEQCKEYLSYIKKCDWDSLDELFFYLRIM